MKIQKVIIIPLTLMIAGALISSLIAWSSIKPVKREILIKARQYAYEPEKLEVNKGDTLIIKLVSMDVVHGFYVEGYDIDVEILPNQKEIKVRRPSKHEDWQLAEEIVIITDKTGKFRYRCSHTCGTMHPFMQGELIVQPNTPYHASIGGVIGFAIGLLISFRKAGRKTKN